MEIHADVYLIFLGLAISYFCSFLVTFCRMRDFGRFLPEFKSARLLYYFLLIQISFRVLSFWYFCIFSEQLDFTNSSLTFALMTIPDSLLICSLIVLLWVIITSNIYTRIDSDEQNLSVWNIPALYRMAMIILKVLIVWICFELMLYIFLSIEKLSRRFIVFQQCAWSVIASAAVIYAIISLQVRYSGVPFKNSSEAKIMKNVNFVSLIWSLSRTIHVILFLVREVALTNPDDLDEISDSTGFLIVAVCDFLITELLCYYLVLSRNFMKTFNPRKSNDVHIPLITRTPKEILFLEIKDEQSEDPSLIVNEEFSRQKGKLGSLYSGVLNERAVVIRRIILKRVSPYVLEQLQQEVESIRNVSNPYLLHNLKVVIKKPAVDIITPLVSGGSLFAAIHAKKYKFSVKEKFIIAKNIALGLKITHDHGRIHGHLTSCNSLLDAIYSNRIIII